MSAAGPLLFIDTNILLDFYRIRSEAGIKLLEHIDGIRDRVVTTYQVEMEFKKHRQQVIIEGFKSLKCPDPIQRPGIFSEAKEAKALANDIKRAEQRIRSLKKRMTQVFEKPTTHDRVYQVAQRLFNKTDAITLSRDKQIRFKMRALARKRFLLGYPPRKAGDTSMGDAINWEWLIHVAKTTRKKITIVSRDADYGAEFEKHSYINDWLLQEFKQRVKCKGNCLLLFHRLSDALKSLNVKISAQEETEEDAIVTAHQVQPLATEQAVKTELTIPELMEMMKTSIQRPVTKVFVPTLGSYSGLGKTEGTAPSKNPKDDGSV